MEGSESKRKRNSCRENQETIFTPVQPISAWGIFVKEEIEQRENVKIRTRE